MAEHKGFYATFWQLIRILKPFPAALLVALSILETALVAKGTHTRCNTSGEILLDVLNLFMLQLVKCQGNTTSSLWIDSPAPS